jgi:hypothetical protein
MFLEAMIAKISNRNCSSFLLLIHFLPWELLKYVTLSCPISFQF